MIELLQQNNGLIGSLDSIEELKSKDHCRILTISDSHGGFRLFSKIISRFGPDCDAIIFCGDGYSDLSMLLQQANENEEFRKSVPPVIAFVQGNCDPDNSYVNFNIGKNNPLVESLPLGTFLLPKYQILSVNNHNIYICHGHLEGVDFGYELLGMKLQYSECKVAIHGHTHVPCQKWLDDYQIINPGSISRPRGGKPACFSILTVEKDFIDTAFIKIKDFYGNEDSFEVLKFIS